MFQMFNAAQAQIFDIYICQGELDRRYVVIIILNTAVTDCGSPFLFTLGFISFIVMPTFQLLKEMLEKVYTDAIEEQKDNKDYCTPNVNSPKLPEGENFELTNKHSPYTSHEYDCV